jgi:hypothetical protein
LNLHGIHIYIKVGQQLDLFFGIEIFGFKVRTSNGVYEVNSDTSFKKLNNAKLHAPLDV